MEVILCAGPEGATRDFDDFSTTEHLIALGRAEASEIVRRYGLGTVPHPAPPWLAPTPVDAAQEPPADPAVPSEGEPSVGSPVEPPAASAPDTQPVPGT